MWAKIENMIMTPSLAIFLIASTSSCESEVVNSRANLIENKCPVEENRSSRECQLLSESEAEPAQNQTIETETSIDKKDSSIQLPSATGSTTIALETTTSYFFENTDNPSFDGSSLNQVNGGFSLKTLDEKFSSKNFSNGTHDGTKVDQNSNLSIDTASPTSLDAAWAPQKENIIGYWNFDNNLSDSSQFAINHGVATGGTSFSEFSVAGSGSLMTDGMDGYLEIPHAAIFDFSDKNFSISFWTNRQTDCSDPTWDNTWGVSKWNTSAAPGSNEWNIGFCAGDGLSNAIRFSIESGTTSYGADANFVYQENEWLLITAVRNNENIVLYVNGIAMDTVNIGTVAINNQNIGIRLSSSQMNGNYSEALYDELAIWNSALTSTEVYMIFQRQKFRYSGIYTSQIYDAGDSYTWGGFTPKTALPYSKEFPSKIYGSESSTNYLDLVGSTGASIDNDLMSDLVGLWHLNATEVTSGPGNDILDHSVSQNNSEIINSATLGGNGVFGNSIHFNGVNQYISLGSGSAVYPTVTNSFSYSFWALPEKDRVIHNEVNSGNSGTSGHSFAIFPTQGSVTYGSGDVGVGISVGVNGISVYEHQNSFFPAILVHNVTLVGWQHIAVVYDNKTPKLYLNGELVRVGLTSSKIPHPGFEIASGGPSNYGYYKGSLDEVAIWSRILHPAEITQIYQRGINAASYQIRTCMTSDCSGSEWLGAQGDSLSQFSELYNNSILDSNAQPKGETLAVPVTLDFLRFLPLDPSPILGRYFQYRIFLQSNDRANLCSSNTTPCLPKISDFKIGLDTFNKFILGENEVLVGKPIIRESLVKLQILAADKNNCQFAFQLKDSKNTYYYELGTQSWKIPTNNQFSNFDDNSNDFSTFPSLEPLIRINLQVIGNGNSDCHVEGVSATYN